MKLLRLKITDPAGFRSLPCGFEHHFRSEWSQQEERARNEGFAPFVCAGPNGSGKSNLLEALAAIFYQLELQRVRRSFLPDIFEYDPVDNPEGIQEHEGTPNAYELEYLLQVPKAYRQPDGPSHAHVRVLKEPDKSPWLAWINNESFVTEGFSTLTYKERNFLLPDYVLGYSSGENEVLSLPFFKLRFVAFDEYWTALRERQAYPGHPDARLIYLDSSFSQAILLCNLLFQDAATLQPFCEDVGIEALHEFRIILRRSIALAPEQLTAFTSEDQDRNQSLDDIVRSNPALQSDTDDMGAIRYSLNLMHLLEGNEKSSLAVSALRRCATLWFEDEAGDTLVLDYRVDAHTRAAFQANFDGPRALFQALQVLLTLNLYTVSDSLKADLYRSSSDYVRETVPTLASDERVMRFKDVSFRKQGVDQPLSLKSLSDGEHQLLHSLGLCTLFSGSRCLFLLDEPETHFNPDWRASFITRLSTCLGDGGKHAEMLMTTHSSFPISDSTPDKVLLFSRDTATGELRVTHPDYNTLGASINKITMKTFSKRETIGGHAQILLNEFRCRFEEGNEDKEALITEIHQKLGDSVEKILLINAILDDGEKSGEAQS